MIKAQLQATVVFTRAKAISKDRCSNSHPTKTANIISYDDSLVSFHVVDQWIVLHSRDSSGAKSFVTPAWPLLGLFGWQACKIWSFGA